MLSFIPLINHIHMYTCMFTLTQCVNKYRYKIQFFCQIKLQLIFRLIRKKYLMYIKTYFLLIKKMFWIFCRVFFMHKIANIRTMITISSKLRNDRDATRQPPAALCELGSAEATVRRRGTINRVNRAGNDSHIWCLRLGKLFGLHGH